MTVARRSFLMMGATAGVATLASPLVASADPRVGSDPFGCGVASGEPWPDGVVLWTRLSPDPVALDGLGGLRDPRQTIPVEWEVSRDPSFAGPSIARRGEYLATPEWGHSVHAEVSGLEPGREYWYRFRVGNEISPVGRTKTAPAAGADNATFTSAAANCQNYTAGYFTALRHLADEQVDVIMHNGDYIYENGATGSLGRAHLPAKEIWDLADYRVRYGQYNSDPDMMAAHASAPFVCVYDDHEVENNWAADRSQIDNEPDQDPAVFLERRARAFKAWYENLPLRLAQRPVGSDVQTYRHLQFGRLADVHVVDTRQYRSFQNPGSTNATDRWSPGRTLLGDRQEQWLLDGLADATTRWRVVENQIHMAQTDQAVGDAVNVSVDTWDGYAWYRQQLFAKLHAMQVRNFVNMAGNAHWNLASDLLLDFEDPSSPVIGTDFMATSISSGGDGTDLPAAGRRRLEENPWIHLVNHQRGYHKTTYTRTELRQEIRVVPFVTRPGAPVSTRATAVVVDGVPGINELIQA